MQTQLTKHFNLTEFSCPCCGITPDFNSAFRLAVPLEAIRQELNYPIIITSALRCVPHNTEVNGVPNSQHLLGNAVDISSEGVSPCVLAMLAYRHGFRSIGIGSDFVHLDMRNFADRFNLGSIWHY